VLLINQFSLLNHRPFIDLDLLPGCWDSIEKILAGWWRRPAGWSRKVKRISSIISKELQVSIALQAETKHQKFDDFRHFLIPGFLQLDFVGTEGYLECARGGSCSFSSGALMEFG